MKKSHVFTDLSDRKCSVKGCGKRLKKRIVEVHPQADLCYAHHQELERRNPRYKGGKKIKHPKPQTTPEAPEVNHG